MSLDYRLELWQHSMETADWNILPLWLTAETRLKKSKTSLFWTLSTLWFDVRDMDVSMSLDSMIQCKQTINISRTFQHCEKLRHSNICTPHTPPDSTFDHQTEPNLFLVWACALEFELFAAFQNALKYADFIIQRSAVCDLWIYREAEGDVGPWVISYK